MRMRIGVRVRFVQRDGAVHRDELQRRAAGADRAPQVPRADLADDLDGEVGLDAAVHGFRVDVGIDLQREPGAHRTVHGGEPDIAVGERLHVGFDAAVDRRRLHRTGRGIHRDAAVHRRGFDGSADAVDFQTAVHRRGIDGDVAGQLNREAHRDVVLFHTVHPVIAAFVAALLARVPQRADGEATLAEHGDDSHALRAGLTPALLDVDHDAVARSRDDFDRTVRIADPDVLVRLDQRPVIPRIADLTAAAEQIPAVAIAPIEIAKRAQRTEGARDVDFDATNEQAGTDDHAEQHAAADDFATPRAPDTPSGCGRSRLIQRHVHGYEVVRTFNLTSFASMRDRPPKLGGRRGDL